MKRYASQAQPANKRKRVYRDFTSPLVDVQCFLSPDSKDDVSVSQAYIIKVFQQNLICVRFLHNPPHTRDGYGMIRNGIDWPVYLKKIIRCYRLNLSVPYQFKLLKRIPDDLLTSCESHEGTSLIQIFKKFRLTGYLRPLPRLTKTTCPKELPWDEMKLTFQDFKNSRLELPGL